MTVGYIERAHDYARRVTAREEAAGELEILACQRFIDDLQREGDGAWPYFFNADAAARPCGFIEGLRHIKGQWAQRRLTLQLEDWQIFLVCNLFGWLHRDTGLRRFTTAYWEVARKNSKSTLGAGIGLYMFAADGEAGSEVYSAATTGKQAEIVFNIARAMERKERAFRAAGVLRHKRGLYMPDDDRKFEPLNAEGNSLDGLNIHCAIVDELHAHPTREVWDVMNTGRGAREQSLLLGITTAGFNRSGVCFEQRNYLVKILQGHYSDDNYFGIIYTLDDEDDWTDRRNWRKANPNYGISVNPEQFEQELTQAMGNVGAQDAFKTKRLNIWVSGEKAWMDMRLWKKCELPGIKAADYAHLPNFLGVDLAQKIDMCAKATLAVDRCADDGPTFYLFVKYYISSMALENSTNSQYRAWVAQGWLTVTPGNVTDFDIIEEDILADKRALGDNLIECGYDPHNAIQLASHLLDEGVGMVEIPQNVRHLSEPLKELQALAYSGRLVHDGNPITDWMASNVYVEPDRNQNIFPRRQRPENKIDGVVAAIIALNRSLANQGADISDFLLEPIIG